MNASIGVLLIMAALLLFQFAYMHHHRPVPSRWTRQELVTQLYVCFCLSVLAAGVGFLVNFLTAKEDSGFGVAELGELAVGVVIAGILFEVMRRQWRRIQTEAPAPPEAGQPVASDAMPQHSRGRAEAGTSGGARGSRPRPAGG